MPAGLQSRGGVEEINVLGKNLIREEGKERRSAEARWTEAAGLEKKAGIAVRGGIESPEDGSGDATSDAAHATKSPGTRGQPKIKGRGPVWVPRPHDLASRRPLTGRRGGVQNPAWGPVEGGKTRASPNRSPESPRSARGPGASGVEATRRGARDVLGGRTHHLASRTLANERLLR